MKLLLLALAIVSDAMALLVALGMYGNFQWPPSRDITPFWVAQLIASGVAVIFSGACIWYYLRARSSCLVCILPVTSACFAAVCFAIAIYYPVWFQHRVSESAALIRADLDRFARQQSQP